MLFAEYGTFTEQAARQMFSYFRVNPVYLVCFVEIKRLINNRTIGINKLQEEER